MSKLIIIIIYLLLTILFLILFLISLKIIHPFLWIIFIILFNIIICIKISLWHSNYIYSILLFLIIISGLLIIFIYFSRLISNEQVYYGFNLKLCFLFNVNSLIYLIYWFKFQHINFYLFNFSTNKRFSFNLTFINKLQNLINLYNYPTINFTILRIFFILLAFITIIKINSSSHSLSIRKIIFYE